METKYQNAKIYKIADVGYKKCYIGSTIQSLSNRMARHRSHYRNGTQETNAKLLFDEFGIDNCKIELIKNDHTKNIASPFINHKKSWESEESFQIPKDLIKNIEDNLGFKKPSTIQSVSIPLIASEPYHSLIAQAKNGTGKTGAFAIGTALRIQRDSPET